MKIIGKIDERAFGFGLDGFAAARQLDIEAVSKRTREFLSEILCGLGPMHLQR
jgi:hypothetical protein